LFLLVHYYGCRLLKIKRLFEDLFHINLVVRVESKDEDSCLLPDDKAEIVSCHFEEILEDLSNFFIISIH
jgi:hypothetical protein